MNISAVIQARTGSTRLPGKVLKMLCGTPILAHVIRRVKPCKRISGIIVATTDRPHDDVIAELALKEGTYVFRGSESDVLDRYYKAAKRFDADIIVRITSDDPLVDYEIVDRVIENLLETGSDYSCNNMPPTYPYGLDAECFTFNALEKAWENAADAEEREHVTPYIRKHKDIFKLASITSDTDYSDLRLTLDTQDDFERIDNIYRALYGKNELFSMQDIIQYLSDSGKYKGKDDSIP